MLDDCKWEEVRLRLEALLGQKILKRKIRAIGINPPYHGQTRRLIEVGGRYGDLEPGAPTEPVLAIYETKLFCVCTPSRGIDGGLPYLFTRDTVYRVDEFPG